MAGDSGSRAKELTSYSFLVVFANDRTAGIRLNVVGREAQGIVQPGAEFDAVCRQLMTDLSDVVNAETGEPIADEILMTGDYHEGPYSDHLPDILVTWNRSHPINAAQSPKIGTVDKTGLVLTRSGDHRPLGRFFGLAEDWPARQLNAPVRVEEFAPTFAALLGVSPSDDGRDTIAALHPHEPKRRVKTIEVPA